MSTRALLTTTTFAWTLAASSFAEDKLWVNEFEKAKATAKAEGKDLLMDFTGSDWCSWCIKLRKEVFDLDGFKAVAPKNFVLVELDYPHDKSKLSKEVQAQNEKLQTQFAIEGFPTIILADAAGRPYAQTGYQEGGDAEYLKHLDGLREVRVKRDAAWKKADGAQGIEKAKLLAEGIKALDEELAAKHYKSVIDEVAKLDPKDETGLVGMFGFKSEFDAVKTKIMEAAQKGEVGEARKSVDEFIGSHAKITVAQKQEALMSVLAACRPPKDNEVVLKLMGDVKALDAESEAGKRAVQIEERVKQMLQEGSTKPAAESKPVPKKGGS